MDFPFPVVVDVAQFLVQEVAEFKQNWGWIGRAPVISCLDVSVNIGEVVLGFIGPDLVLRSEVAFELDEFVGGFLDRVAVEFLGRS